MEVQRESVSYSPRESVFIGVVVEGGIVVGESCVLWDDGSVKAKKACTGFTSKSLPRRSCKKSMK